MRSNFSKTNPLFFFCAAAILSWGVSCSDDGSAASSDAASSADTSLADQGGAGNDADSSDDSSTDQGDAQPGDGHGSDSDSSSDGAGNTDGVATDATNDSGLPATCSGGCAQQTLSATFGSASEPFAQAGYGLDQDQNGNPGLYLEAWDGGFSGCPEQDSPTPDRTLIISGLPLPQSGPALTLADGLVISLLDYQGTLLPSAILSKATAASVSFVAADVCTACIGQPAPADPDGFLALEVSAIFDEGTVTGHVYAGHCDSLDL